MTDALSRHVRSDRFVRAAIGPSAGRTAAAVAAHDLTLGDPQRRLGLYHGQYRKRHLTGRVRRAFRTLNA
jgi:hypothetical protein